MTDHKGRTLYGVTELAERLDIKPSYLRVKLSRNEVPTPDVYLSNRPVWYAATIDKWLAER